MAQTTTENFGLIKDDEDNFYDINVINQNWDKVDKAIKLASESGGSGVEVGSLEELLTNDKTSLVAAVNECFCDASEGKAKVASTITGIDNTITFTQDITYSQLSSGVTKIGDALNEAIASAANDRKKIREAILVAENSTTSGMGSNPTANQLANYIKGNLVSAKNGNITAFGEKLSSSTIITIYGLTTSNSSKTYYIEVNGLNFKPKRLMVYGIGSNGIPEIIFMYDATNVATNLATYKTSDEINMSINSNIYIMDGAFKVPVSKAATTYYYIAVA